MPRRRIRRASDALIAAVEAAVKAGRADLFGGALRQLGGPGRLVHPRDALAMGALARHQPDPAAEQQAAVGAAEARRQNDAPSEQSGQQRNKPQAESADTGDSQPEIAGEADKAEGDTGTDKSVKDDSATDDSGDAAKDDAEVVKLSPAELAEAVQEEQDSASA